MSNASCELRHGGGDLRGKPSIRSTLDTEATAQWAHQSRPDDRRAGRVVAEYQVLGSTQAMGACRHNEPKPGSNTPELAGLEVRSRHTLRSGSQLLPWALEFRLHGGRIAS